MAAVFAISDLHLSLAAPRQKRMSRFGERWSGHPEDLFTNWSERVGGADWVLCPGDLSWASRPGELAHDFARIDALPGFKLLSPGNHDRGPWSSQRKISGFCERFDHIWAIARGAMRISAGGGAPGLVIACAKGSLCPEDAYLAGRDPAEQAAELRRFRRQLGRLHFALGSAAALRRPGDVLGVQIHYPPFASLCEPSAYSAAIERAGASFCLFGHLHRGAEHAGVIQGPRGGVEYRLVAADALAMAPLPIGELSEGGFELALAPPACPIDAGARTLQAA
jgi:predicted phosphohydrolase